MKSLLNCATVIAALLCCVSAAGTETPSSTPLHVYAAGSLTGALAEMARQYTAETGQPVDIVNGPAGLLRERIEKGADADVYISANMAHPERLADEGKGTPAVVFARNSLCIEARKDVGLTSSNLLDKLLEPTVKIGTSTPLADPGGDYAWAWFAKADTLHPGAGKILQAKAQKLVGGAVPSTIPGNASPVKYFLMQKKVDVFFGYCSSHEADAKPDPDLVKVVIPADLSIPVDYGMTVLLHPGAADRQIAAYRFASYLMTPAAQHRLLRYGFIPVADIERP
jgi:molybdate transport system substrate-binding protein